MKTDIEIAQANQMTPIVDIAKELEIPQEYVEPYGHYKAKISYEFLKTKADKKNGKLVLVTAINPTPAGEGKTTTTIGLVQAFNQMGKRAIATLREPSLGPCMGVKGGAAGGGYSQVVPMEDINLHFTGDIHAVTSAHNLLAAMIDNHLQQGNSLQIDTRQITFKRVMDMNDRALRHIVVGLRGKVNGVPREDGFMISVASEVMAILCLSNDLEDLKNKLGNMIVAYSTEGKAIYAKDIGAEGAMTVLLKDALKPNLVQTLEHTPVFIHGGPFANIAHGCNSLLATKMALKLSDITVTEAGFGADLGAEKFFDIKCRMGNLTPDAVVLVATIRALKYNGNVPKHKLNEENLDALTKGLSNLEKHIENLKNFHLPVIVSLNHFYTDTDAEVLLVQSACEKLGVPLAISKVWAEGGKGGIELANLVLQALENDSDFQMFYEDSLPVKEKIQKIATIIYGAKDVVFSPQAEKDLQQIQALGFDQFPVCIAKTQYSLSDDPSQLGRPENFTLHIKSLNISAGAGFIVVLTGDIMTMPGLPKVPSAVHITIDSEGKTLGLF